MNRHNAILIVVTNHEALPGGHKTGLWLEEYAVPAGIFKQAGMKITIASLKGGAAPIDPRSLPEKTDDPSTREALEELKHTVLLSEVNLAEYDAVFFPGGHGTMFDLPEAREIGKTIAEFDATERVVGAVCHGPAAFVGATRRDGSPVIKGKRLTGFTNDEERSVELDKVMPFLLQSRLEELGARFVTSPNWNDNVVVDGNLITGQNPQSSASTANALLEAINKSQAA
jgi:putative intracellular protease/amidase